MIEFNFETDFELLEQDRLAEWIEEAIVAEGFKVGDINYIFCDDEYLHKLNVDFLNHDTLTDIISFDYTVGELIQGDIFISIDRVADNANFYNVKFEDELKRVIIHGILHYCGYKDKSDIDAITMRDKENYYLTKVF